MKGCRIYVENVSFIDRLIIKYYNFRLWASEKIYKGARLEDEQKYIITLAYCLIYGKRIL